MAHDHSEDEDVRALAEADRALAEASDILPAALRRFHVNLIEQGFSKHEALQITIAYLDILMQEPQGGGEE